MVPGLLLLVALSGPAGADEDVSVRENAGVYTVTARFQVAESAPVALAVLTDYEQIPRFMPDVRKSVVRERLADGGVIVEQEAVAKMMMFTRKVHLLLEVRTDGIMVRFRDASGRSFERYEGAWRLEQLADGTTAITYELSARPSFQVPEFLLKKLLKRDARNMIERLRIEMAARAKLNTHNPPSFF